MSGVVLDVLAIGRWRQVERVLDRALELDPRDVPAHLADACAGDEALRGHVEALLEADRGAQGFLRVPAIEQMPSLTIPDRFVHTGATTGVRNPLPVLPEAPPPLRVGRYTVLEELGRGGMGIVYLGRDESLGRTVAIKALPEPVAADPIRLTRFLSEAKSLGALDHPNIAAIHGVVHGEGRRYLILERVEGATLSELLRAGPLPMFRALDVCAQAAEALAAAHAQGIVHRDLKPGNLMITPGGLVKVLDFGLAMHAAWREPGADTHAAPGVSEHTRTGAQFGTPGFMSPEQILDRPQDARTDLFALGCVLYQCLTGVRAFAGASLHAVFSATLSGNPDKSRLPAATPESVRRLLNHLLEKDPESRLADAGEAAAALAGARAALESPRAREPVRDPRSARLPEAAIPFVGRTREIDASVQLLRRERLVTLTGAGGSGKTRLAVEIARAWPAEQPVWFVDLATAHDEAGVIAALAAALELRDSSPSRLIDAIERDPQKRAGLLVLDNCEHALAACAALVTQLLSACGVLRVLATSREWLGAAGEQTLRVPPLELPDPEVKPTAASIASVESVRLFLACAAQGRSGFQLTDVNAPLVATLCRRLDGVPLALELTAALLRDRTLESVAAELDLHLQHDAGSAPHSRPANALQAAFQLSYERLAADERRAFRALSVFAGGWDLESATWVGGFQADEFAALDVLTRLVDASLVTIQRAGKAEPRYRFLEPIRQFAAARREAANESLELIARHVDCFLASAERMAPALMSRTDQARWFARLETDHANVLAALRACESLPGGAHSALRLAGAVWMFWYVRGHFTLGRDALARALALPGAGTPSPVRAQALFAAGGLAVFQGDYTEGRRLNGAALDLFREHRDALGMGRSLNHLALCDGGQGRFDEARQRFRDAIRIFEDLGDTRRLSVAMNNLGVVERQQGDYRTALGTFEKTLERVRQAGDRDSMIVTLVNLALVSSRLGAIDDAARWIGEGLTHVADLGAKRAGAAALETAAEVLIARGRSPEAAALLGAAAALRAAIDLAPDAWWQTTLRDLTERVRTELGSELYDQHAGEGGRRRFDDAIADARRWIEQAQAGRDRAPNHIRGTPSEHESAFRDQPSRSET